MPNGNDNLFGTQAIAEESFNSSVENEAEDSFNTDVENEAKDSFNDNSVENEAEDSFNDNSDNSVDNSVENEAEDSFNSDVEIEDSYNVENDAEDSFNDNSDNMDLDVEVEIEDSFNDNSDNSVKTQDSFNITSSFNTQTLNDHSTTVGVRQYQTNVGDLNLGGMGGMLGGKAAYGHGGGADLELDNRSMNLDQSVNQVIHAGGDVEQDFSQTANVAFGDHSMAAGDDIDIDNSSMSMEFGDIWTGNTWNSTTITDSFNDYSQEHEYEWNMEIEDSYNDESTDLDYDVEIEDSFTSEVTQLSSFEWENEGNIFSPGAATTGGEITIED